MRLTIIIVCLIFLALISYCGRYTALWLDSESTHTRGLSIWMINNVFGWDYQQKNSLSSIDFLHSKYEKYKIIDPARAKQLIMASCQYVLDNNTYDPSVSLFNALVESDEVIIGFWLHRKISLESLKIESVISGEFLTLEQLLERISLSSKNQEYATLIKAYKENPNLKIYLPDPCKTHKSE